jgi:acetyl esterase/lipase
LAVGLALLCSVVAAAATVWIVVPAPTYTLWLVAVAASEWALWFGLLGLLGAALAAAAPAEGGRSRRRARLLAIGLGLTAFALSLVPVWEAAPVARENGVRLSLHEYLFGAVGSPEVPAPETLVYTTTADGQALALDVYLPPPRPSLPSPRRPAIVVVHGGSWRGGNRSDFPHWDRWLARQGFVVFDIAYRLAPAPNWQTATGDVKCAVAWVKRNAARYGVDPGRVALLGRSAGGHLALLAAYSPDAPPLASGCAAGHAAGGAGAVVALYAPTDLLWGYRHPADPDVLDTSAVLRAFLGGSPAEVPDAYRQASPVRHVGAGSPPTLLLHGRREALVSPRHTEFLAARLRAAGVPHRAVFLPYAQHGFDYNLHGWGAQIAKPVLLRFLRVHLGPGETATPGTLPDRALPAQ